MTMTIVVDECTGCGDCEPVCPTQAIASRRGAFAIDAGRCTECEGEYEEPQCLSVCPIDGCILPLEA